MFSVTQTDKETYHPVDKLIEELTQLVLAEKDDLHDVLLYSTNSESVEVSKKFILDLYAVVHAIQHDKHRNEYEQMLAQEHANMINRLLKP